MKTSDPSGKWWLNWNFKYANEDVYGPLKGGHTIQEGFYTTLQKWLPAYIHEFNRNLGGNVLTVPRDYRQRPDYRQLPKDPSASILVICDGTTRPPERHQHDTRSIWGVKMSVWMAGTTDWQETQALTFAYGAACRAAISQHPGLEGVAETTLWTGEKYMEKEHVSLRTIGLLVVDFETTVASTVDTYAGPPNPLYTAEGVINQPSILPPDPVPIADTVNVQVENGTTD